MQFNYKTPKPKKCNSFFAVKGEPDLAMPNRVLLSKIFSLEVEISFLTNL